MQLRPYQDEAVAKTMQCFETKQAVLVVMATGTGKTPVMGEIAKRYMEQGRVLLLAHREELIFQGQKTLERVTGERPEIEMADNWASKGSFLGGSRLICSTIQTQISGRDGGRMTRFVPEDFSLVLVDECFVAGTMVGGMPIEKIRTGDYVPAWDGKVVQYRRVSHAFKRPARFLVRVTLKNGASIICTPSHPVYSADCGEYVPAALLTNDSHVLFRSEYAVPQDVHRVRDAVYGDVQQGDMLEEVRDGSPMQTKGSDCCPAVRGVPEAGGVHRSEWSCCGPAGTSVLFGGMQADVPSGTIVEDHGKDEPQVRLCQDDGEKPHAACGCEGKGVAVVDGTRPDEPRREREASACASEVACGGIGLANGSRHQNQNAERQRVSTVLQGGHRQCGDVGGCGSGRQFSCADQPAGPGPEEDGISGIARVDRVEILECGGDGRFGGLCSDGCVYNLEVEEYNNYFANGILVHNCHHATASSYRKVIEYYRRNPNLKICGVTATPDRADEEALGQVFDDVSFEFDIMDGVNGGWLCPIMQQMVHIDGLDFSNVRTTAGELNGKDLAEVLEFEQNLHGMTTPILELCGDKKTLVFTATIAQAERMAEILNRHKPGSAEYVSGETPREYRRSLFQRYAQNQFQYLVNVAVTTEGFDEPGIEWVVQARPTKSRAVYSQQIGRSTRPLPGVIDGIDGSEQRRAAIARSKKPHACVLDFVGNAGRHKLIHVADVLGGKYSDEVIELASRNAEKEGKPADIASELVKAEREIDRRRRARQEAETRAKIKLQSKYRTSTIDPFDVLDIIPGRVPGWHQGRPASDGQKRCLEKFGVNIPEDLGFTRASQLIDTLIKRSQSQLASYKQVKLLKSRGLYRDGMTFSEARKAIDGLAQSEGWGQRKVKTA